MTVSNAASAANGIAILFTARPTAGAEGDHSGYGDHGGAGNHGNDVVDSGALGLPAILLPLQGRSLLQRAVEQLARAGCRQIHVALGDDAAPIKDFLQSGERWGCRITYHYLDPRESVARFMRRLDLAPQTLCWLADAARVPMGPMPASSLADAAATGTAATVRPLFWNDAGQPRWSGWGVFSADWLAQCTQPPEALDVVLPASCELQSQTIEPPLSAVTLAELHVSSRRLLTAQAVQSAPVVTGRGSQIHPSARIIAPVYIGEQVKIGAGAVIGPDVAIEPGTFIERGAHLRDSVVLSDTFVGAELDLHGIVARGSLLANIPLNIVTEIPDPHLLSDLPRQGLAAAPRQRLVAAALRLGLAPLQWLSLWRTRGWRDGEHAPATISFPRGGQSEPGAVRVSLALPEEPTLPASATSPATSAITVTPPTSTAPRLALHFCRTFYPGLRDVMRGSLQLAGPTPRRLGAVRQLPPEWRRLYGEYRCGLLNEGLLQPGAATSTEDQFASDALACAHQGDLRATLRLLRRYLGLLLSELGSSHPYSVATRDENPATHHRTI